MLHFGPVVRTIEPMRPDPRFKAGLLVLTLLAGLLTGCASSAERSGGTPTVEQGEMRDPESLRKEGLEQRAGEVEALADEMIATMLPTGAYRFEMDAVTVDGGRLTLDGYVDLDTCSTEADGRYVDAKGRSSAIEYLGDGKIEAVRMGEGAWLDANDPTSAAPKVRSVLAWQSLTTPLHRGVACSLRNLAYQYSVAKAGSGVSVLALDVFSSGEFRRHQLDSFLDEVDAGSGVILTDGQREELSGMVAMTYSSPFAGYRFEVRRDAGVVELTQIDGEGEPVAVFLLTPAEARPVRQPDVRPWMASMQGMGQDQLLIALKSLLS